MIISKEKLEKIKEDCSKYGTECEMCKYDDICEEIMRRYPITDPPSCYPPTWSTEDIEKISDSFKEKGYITDKNMRTSLHICDHDSDYEILKVHHRDDGRHDFYIYKTPNYISIWSRFKFAMNIFFNVLRTGEILLGGVILSKIEINKLVKFLQEGEHK